MNKIYYMSLFLISFFYSTESYSQDKPKNQPSSPVIIHDKSPKASNNLDNALDVPKHELEKPNIGDAENQKESNENKVFTVVQFQPTFPGGKEALEQFIKDNLVYPDTVKTQNIKGKVIVSFKVQKTGQLTNIKIVRDQVGYGAGEEVLKMILKMPLWLPAKQNTTLVRCDYTLAIGFNL